MKKCSKCLAQKDLDCFAFKNKSKNKYSAECKECHRLLRDNSYKRNKVKCISQTNAWKKEQKRKFFLWLEQQSCMDCGISDIRVLEFDHRQNKLFSIANKISSVTFETLSDELNKCDIVCANCHRIRTAKQRNYYAYMRD